MAWVLAALVAGASLPARSAAQVRITVVDSASRAAVPNALVSLVDSAGRTVGEGLTDREGSHVFGAIDRGRGRFTVRVRRIGYAPYLSPAPVTAAGGRDAQRVVVPFRPFQLAPVVVVAAAKECRLARELAVEAASIWDQVRTSLRVVQLGRDEQRAATRAESFERTLSTSDRLLDDRVIGSGLSGARPFTSADPALLESRGYVVRDSSGTRYFGPSVDVLLSPEFEADHCLRTVAGERRDRTGLAFEPVADRAVPDIRGTIWLDSATLVLRSVEFRFVSRRPDSLLTGAGGYVQFQTLPTGVVFESSWLLRMPRWRESILQPGRIELAGWTEVGGEATVIPGGHGGHGG